MGFATKWKTKKICVKEWSKKHIFLSHFFIFHHRPKRMLEFLRNGFWIVIVQKIREKSLSHSGKMHFSVSGHVTLGVARWRHELDYICPLWVLSKFGPIEAYMCRVIASWFFPSNGIKRYFNGPLSEFEKVFERKVWRVQAAHLHNAARALSSPTRSFQLSRQIFISLSLILW